MIPNFYDQEGYIFLSQNFEPQVISEAIDHLVWWLNWRWTLKIHFRFEWSTTDYDFWSRSVRESVHCVSLRTLWPHVPIIYLIQTFGPSSSSSRSSLSFGRVQLWICIKGRGLSLRTGRLRTVLIPIRPWTSEDSDKFFRFRWNEDGRLKKFFGREQDGTAWSKVLFNNAVIMYDS